MADVRVLRPTRGQVQSQYRRANHMAHYQHVKGLVLNTGRQLVLWTNIVVSVTALVLSQALSEKHFKLAGAIAAGLVAGFSLAATQLTPKRTADAYDLENAWLRHRDVVEGLLDHIDDPNVTDVQARSLYHDVAQTRKELDDRGIKAIRDEAADLPTLRDTGAAAAPTSRSAGDE